MKTRSTFLNRPNLGIAVILALFSLGLGTPLSAKNKINLGVSLGVQLPRGAVSITAGKDRYYAHRGVYYRKGSRGYHVVPAPRGGRIHQLPRSAVRIVIDTRTYYRHDNVYYVARDGGYEIVPSPRPSTVMIREQSATESNDYESVWLGDQEYRFKNGQFFKPTSEGLVWVIAPTGATIRNLPKDTTTVWHNEIEYFEVDDVVFRKTPDGYKVVTTPWD